MDFLEKICYIHVSKRLRKRFSHYSQSLSGVNPSHQGFPVVGRILGVIFENN